MLINNEYKKYTYLLEIRNLILSGKSIYDIKLRVAYYSRVSTDSLEQATSIVNQNDYFINLIENAPNWTFVGGYTDEGISGKNVLKRDSFLQMIEDAKNDKFDLILTKSVSRFARNTLDSIKYTNELLKYGVGVFFLNDNINTVMQDSEFRLTIMASMAQDDIRRLSENVTFGLNQSIKRGVVLGSNNIYGYIKNKGKLEILPEEANIIKDIFTLYDSYSSLKKTAIRLEKMGYMNRKNKPFDTTTIRRILMNPKYKGYYCGKKTTIVDYKTGVRKALPKEKWILYPDKENVPPIVSEELWDKVNAELERKQIGYKNNQKVTVRTNYAYSGKLICKEHNVAFTRSGEKKGRKKDYRYWSCRLYKKGVEYCDSPLLKEEELDILFKDIIKNFLVNKDVIIESLLKKIKKNSTDDSLIQKLDNINKSIEELENKKNKLLELVVNNFLTNEEFGKKNNDLNRSLEILNSEKLNIQSSISKGDTFESQIKVLYEALNSELDVDTNFAPLMDILIDKVFVSKIDNDRTKINLDIIFKFGRRAIMLYDTKMPIINQLIKLPVDTIKFVLDELNKFPPTDHNINSSFTS